MKSKIFVPLVATLLLYSFQQVHAEPSSKNGAESDIHKLQGTWIADTAPNQQLRLTLDKSKLKLFNISGGAELLVWDGHFGINELACPKQMDWTSLRREDRIVPANLAIYHLMGDYLLMIGNNKGPRPTAFYTSGTDKDSPKTLIFRRAPSPPRASLEIRPSVVTPEFNPPSIPSKAQAVPELSEESSFEVSPPVELKQKRIQVTPL